MCDNTKDYTKSVNLPTTEFPMRANLPQREPETLEYWESIDLYNKLMERNKGKKPFVLHDGPPYANGDIHMGHALNKILKDIILSCGKLYCISVNSYFFCVSVECKTARDEHIFRFLHTSECTVSSYLRFDSCCQLKGIKGLCDIIVTAYSQTCYFV